MAFVGIGIFGIVGVVVLCWLDKVFWDCEWVNRAFDAGPGDDLEARKHFMLTSFGIGVFLPAMVFGGIVSVLGPVGGVIAGAVWGVLLFKNVKFRAYTISTIFTGLGWTRWRSMEESVGLNDGVCTAAYPRIGREAVRQEKLQIPGLLEKRKGLSTFWHPRKCVGLFAP
jgi:hypothetical protein